MVVGLYLNSNLGSEGVGIDGGLILTQAALERLSHQEEGNTGEKIAVAIEKLGIPRDIPPSCSELLGLQPKVQTQKKESLTNGPRALVRIRNDIVHPEQTYNNISPKAYYEAWNLGQWYIESILLKLCEYSGEYGHRITRKWRGEVESLQQWLVNNIPSGTDLGIPSTNGENE
jgi:hypothetical protein